jgi:hypothetical protein
MLACSAKFGAGNTIARGLAEWFPSRFPVGFFKFPSVATAPRSVSSTTASPASRLRSDP